LKLGTALASMAGLEDEPLSLLDDGALEHVLSFLRSSQVQLATHVWKPYTI
jgi:hypothetical protein